MVKLNPFVLKELKKVDKDYKSHRDKLKYYEKLIGSLRSRKNSKRLSDYYNIAGNLALKVATFETPSKFEKKFLLKKARDYYEKSKDLLSWPRYSREMQNLETTIDKISRTLKEPIEDTYRRLAYQKVAVFLIVSTFLLALFFTSLNVTGYSILSIEKDASLFAGVFFFVIGLIIAFIYFRSERKKFEKMGLI